MASTSGVSGASAHLPQFWMLNQPDFAFCAPACRRRKHHIALAFILAQTIVRQQIVNVIQHGFFAQPFEPAMMTRFVGRDWRAQSCRPRCGPGHRARPVSVN